MTIKSKVLQKESPEAPFKIVEIERRDPREDDVVIDIKAAGICHSDIHTIRNEWGQAHFPLTVGHEMWKLWGIRSPSSKWATAWAWAA